MNEDPCFCVLKNIFIGLILNFLLLIPIAFGDNPLPFYGADPNPVQGGDGKMYIFPTNFGPDGARVKDWHVYSSSDLVEWENLGRIIGANDVNWENGKTWAPAATYRNGTLYFCCYFENNFQSTKSYSLQSTNKF